jgi:hypothetical protein
LYVYPIDLMVLPPDVDYGPPSSDANITIQYYLYTGYTYSYASSKVLQGTSSTGYFTYYMNNYAASNHVPALAAPAKTRVATVFNIGPVSPSSQPAVYPSVAPVAYPTYSPHNLPTALPTPVNGNNLFVTQVIMNCSYDEFLYNQAGYVNALKTTLSLSVGFAPIDFTVVGTTSSGDVPASNDFNLTIAYYVYSAYNSYEYMESHILAATTPNGMFNYYMNIEGPIYGAPGLKKPAATALAVIQNLAPASPSSSPILYPSAAPTNYPVYSVFVQQWITGCSYELATSNLAGYIKDISSAISYSTGFSATQLTILPSTSSSTNEFMIEYYVTSTYYTYSQLSSTILSGTSSTGYFNSYMNSYAITYGAYGLAYPAKSYKTTTHDGTPSPSYVPVNFPSTSPANRPSPKPVISPTYAPSPTSGPTVFVTQVIEGCGYDDFALNEAGYVGTLVYAATYSIGFTPLDFEVLAPSADAELKSNSTHLVIQYYLYSTYYTYDYISSRVVSATQTGGLFTYYMNYESFYKNAPKLASAYTLPAVVANVPMVTPSSSPVRYPSAAPVPYPSSPPVTLPTYHPNAVPTLSPSTVFATAFVTQAIPGCKYSEYEKNEAGYVAALIDAVFASTGILPLDLIVQRSDGDSSSALKFQYYLSSTAYSYSAIESLIVEMTSNGVFDHFMNLNADKHGAYSLAAPTSTKPAVVKSQGAPSPTSFPAYYPSAAPADVPSGQPSQSPTAAPSYISNGNNAFVTQIIVGCSYDEFMSNEAGYIADLNYAIRYSINYGSPIDLTVISPTASYGPPSNNQNLTIQYYLYSSYYPYETMQSTIIYATTYGYFNYYMTTNAAYFGADGLTTPTHSKSTVVTNVAPSSPSSAPALYPSAAPVIRPSPNPTLHPSAVPTTVNGNNVFVTQLITKCGYDDFLKNEAGYVADLKLAISYSIGYTVVDFEVVPPDSTTGIPSNDSVLSIQYYVYSFSTSYNYETISAKVEQATSSYGYFTYYMNTYAVSSGAPALASPAKTLPATCVNLAPASPSSSPVRYPSAAPIARPTYAPYATPTRSPTLSTYAFVIQEISGCTYEDYLTNQLGYYNEISLTIYYSFGYGYPIDLKFAASDDGKSLILQYYVHSSVYSYDYVASMIESATNGVSSTFTYDMNYYSTSYGAWALAKPAYSNQAQVSSFSPSSPSSSPVSLPSASPNQKPSRSPSISPSAYPTTVNGNNVFVSQLIAKVGYDDFLKNEAGYVADLKLAISYSIGYTVVDFEVVPPDSATGIPSNDSVLSIQYYLYSTYTSYTYESISAKVAQATSLYGYFTYYMNMYAASYGAPALASPAKTLPATCVNLAPASPSSSPVRYPSASPVARPTYAPYATPTYRPISNPTYAPNTVFSSVYVTLQTIVGCTYADFMQNQAGYISALQQSVYSSMGVGPTGLHVLSSPSYANLQIAYSLTSTTLDTGALSSLAIEMTSNGKFTEEMNHFATQFGATKLQAPAYTLQAVVSKVPVPSVSPVLYPSAAPQSPVVSSYPTTTRYPTAGTPTLLPTAVPVTAKPTPQPVAPTAEPSTGVVTPPPSSSGIVSASMLQYIDGPSYSDYNYNQVGFIQVLTFTIEQCVLITKYAPYIAVDNLLVEPTDSSIYPSTSTKIGISYTVLASGGFTASSLASTMIDCTKDGDWDQQMHEFATVLEVNALETATTEVAVVASSLSDPAASAEASSTADPASDSNSSDLPVYAIVIIAVAGAVIIAGLLIRRWYSIISSAPIKEAPDSFSEPLMHTEASGEQSELVSGADSSIQGV